jgi:hypothetical protein
MCLDGEMGKIQVHQNWFEDATVNQQPPAHHPLDAHYYSVVDEPQMREYLVSLW